MWPSSRPRSPTVKPFAAPPTSRAAQETDRRSRPVRRLLDQDGSPAPRRQVRVRQRYLRWLHPSQLHSRRREGYHRGRREGFLSRFPVVDFRCTVYDGSYHDVDSSESPSSWPPARPSRPPWEVARPTLLRAHHERRDPGPRRICRRPHGRSQQPPWAASPAWIPAAARKLSRRKPHGRGCSTTQTTSPP